MCAKAIAIDAAIKIGESIIQKHFGRTRGSIHHVDGGLFISMMEDGKMMAAYWHPTRRHSATCVHDWIREVQKAYSDPGYWAVAVTNTPLMGAKTFYDVY